MKTSVFTIFILVFSVSAVLAQDSEFPFTQLTAAESLKELSVTKMEDSGTWGGQFELENGLIELRDFPGGPAGKEAIEDEEQFGLGEADESVVGVKISFFRRGISDFSVKPSRPILIEGITKTISVWVAGRNTNHELKLLVSDQQGQLSVLPMGKLNFSGWKNVSVTIPQTVVQTTINYNDRMGLYFEGFIVTCDIDESYGRFYVYFDDIRAVADLSPELNRDLDDMVDSW